MTRKHFERLARFAAEWDLSDAQVQGLVMLCKEFNSNFDMHRFYDKVEELQKQLSE